MTLHRQAYAAAALAALLPVLYILPLITPFWSSRYLVVIVVGACGIPIVLANWGRPEARAAIAFVMVATLSAAVSGSAFALFGDFGLGTGLLFVIGLVGAWALGSIAGSDGRRLLVAALTASAAANALMAIAESVFELREVGFDGYPGRASGFIGNPVFLGGFLAGASWLLVVERVDRRRPWQLPVLAILAIGVQLSGSRAALAVVLPPLAIAIARRCRTGLLTAAVVLGALAAGGVIADSTAGASGTARAADSVAGGGPQARLEVWGSAGSALAERPLIGRGPGRFGVATSPHRTLDLVRAEGTERYFVDAHNLVVEYAVTTGLLGVAALIGWLALTFRYLRPWREPLGGFAVAIFFMHLVQPQNVVLTPLAFLALGAAGPTLALPRWARRAAVASGGLVAPAVAAMALGFFALDQARLDFEQHRADQARRYLPGWTQATEQAARIASLRARMERRPELEEEVLRLRRLAVAENPGDARPLKTLVQYEGQLGLEEQVTTLRALYEADPWSITALRGLGLHHADGGRARGDEARLAVSYLERSLSVGPPNEAVEDLIESLRRRY